MVPSTTPSGLAAKYLSPLRVPRFITTDANSARTRAIRSGSSGPSLFVFPGHVTFLVT